MTLRFNRDFAPRYGEAVEVAAGVRRVTANNPGPFTFLGTNTFLIGTEEIAVLDPGPADSAHIEALMRAVGRARVAHILVSHAHGDHVAAAPLLQARTGASILAAPGERIKSVAAVPLDVEAAGGLSADRVLGDGDIVQVGGYRLETVATPGHASDHLAFALVGTGILFSGDHVMGWATSVVAPPDGSMGDYMASLRRLLARDEPLYFPAHGDAIPQARKHVRALLAHRQMRERSILKRLARGARTIPDIVTQVYPDLDPGLRGAAALSTLAHLEDLCARGIAVAEPAPVLDAAYSLSPRGELAATGAGAVAPG